MKLSNAVLAAGEERHVARVLHESLVRFESDTRPVDPILADDIADYRNAGDMEIFRRIIALTNVGAYERALLAMVLQSGIDVTTDENFSYIVKHPALSGNTKARHLILMAVALEQSREQTA